MTEVFGLKAGLSEGKMSLKSLLKTVPGIFVVNTVLCLLRNLLEQSLFDISCIQTRLNLPSTVLFEAFGQKAV